MRGRVTHVWGTKQKNVGFIVRLFCFQVYS